MASTGGPAGTGVTATTGTRAGTAATAATGGTGGTAAAAWTGAGRADVPLLAVAHGTRDPEGRAATRALLDLIRAERPGLTVELGYVDVAEPLLTDTLATLSGPVVVVPMLLGTGYHVRTDIPAALAAAPQVDARVAGALGPDPRLADVLLERLAEAPGRPHQDPQPVDDGGEPAPVVHSTGFDAIVLAAAGSTDPEANADAARMAALLGDLTGRPVVASYLCASSPTPAEAVAALHADGVHNIAVSGYLMGPGYFARKAARSGATVTAAPLGAHRAIARLVLDRYDAALNTGGDDTA
ncbi:sirohydrochlorin chelatase [Yinghuangia seranimata]|uniref:sirohydrochlorin chelatase n=1 Tax=Yinghuangia seranimata TaxID=408067 RepID=UPI00248CD7DF|nr:CbiX/SirB N-terminal domain-containing protein [Yinghuangia seranimata]MDI2132503.1 CbiX/SirB N-terminal domain-containing protein [Yinghuangia seranimata]